MDRIMGVITLKPATYREIAEDQNATTTAAIIVAVVSLIAGFFGGLVQVDPNTQVVTTSVGRGIVGAIGTVIIGLIAWAVAAWVLAFVARWFGGRTNTGEMLRVTGYVEIFNLVSVITVLAVASSALACIVGLIAFVVAILRLIGYIIGVREAAEFTTGNAIVTAIVAAIVNLVIYLVIGAIILGSLFAAFGLAAAVAQ